MKTRLVTKEKMVSMLMPRHSQNLKGSKNKSFTIFRDTLSHQWKILYTVNLLLSLLKRLININSFFSLRLIVWGITTHFDSSTNYAYFFLVFQLLLQRGLLALTLSIIVFEVHNSADSSHFLKIKRVLHHDTVLCFSLSGNYFSTRTKWWV